MTQKEIVTELLKNGAKKINDVKVRNVTITPQENYVRVSFTVEQPIPAYVQQEDGTYAEGVSNVVFASTFVISSVFKNNAELMFCANHIAQNPQAISPILSGCVLDIVSEPVAAGQEYKNPFSSNEDTVVIEHDTIINHIIDIKLSTFGKKMLDMLAIKMLGF